MIKYSILIDSERSNTFLSGDFFIQNLDNAMNIEHTTFMCYYIHQVFLSIRMYNIHPFIAVSFFQTSAILYTRKECRKVPSKEKCIVYMYRFWVNNRQIFFLQVLHFLYYKIIITIIY